MNIQRIILLIFFVSILFSNNSNKKFCSSKSIISHKEKRGIGYKKGYSSLKYFLWKKKERFSPFLDLRSHLFNDGNFFGNFGFGGRIYSEKINGLFGINGFCDYRRYFKKNFNQLGIGLEFLKNKYFVTINGYLPFGKKEKVVNYTFNSFEKNSLYYNKNVKSSMAGFDINAGYVICNKKDFSLDLFLGGYFYRGSYNHKKIVGAKAGLKAKFFDVLSLNIDGFSDKYFKTHIQGSIGIDISFYKKIVKKSYISTLYKKYSAPVFRHEVIVVSNQKRKRAINPLTNEPYFVMHIDNIGSDDRLVGSGSFEDPYFSLKSAEDNSKRGDIIYVHYGNGTSDGYGGIFLKDDQLILGSGVDHLIYINSSFIIPSMTPLKNPKIVNTTGSGIVLADNNEVAGLDVFSCSENGIIGSSIKIASKIRDCNILDFGSAPGSKAGILISIAPGQSIKGIMEITNNFISSENGGTDGIYINDNLASVAGQDYEISFLIQNNEIVSNQSQGITIERFNNSNNFNVIGVIDNNKINGNASDGIQFTYDAVTNPMNLNVKISNNELIGTASEGVFVARGNGNLYLENNIVGNSSSEGVEITVEDNCALYVYAKANKNFSNGGGTQGFQFQMNGTGTLRVDLHNNCINSSDEYYFDINGAILPVVILNDNLGRLDTTGGNLILTK